MTKEILQDNINAFVEEEKRLTDKLTQLKEERTKFIKGNRAILDSSILPRMGSIFKFTEAMCYKHEEIKGNCRRQTIFDPIETLKYIKVCNRVIEWKSHHYGVGLHLPVKWLDEDFREISSYNELMLVSLMTEPYVGKTTGHLKTKIYLMVDRNTGLTKIGRSKNPTVREKTLQSEKPTTTLTHTWDGIHQDERNLHGMFANKRIRGEWFNLGYQDIKKIHNYFKEKELC